MGNNVTPIRSPWRLAADASDRVTDLIERIPGWAYQYAGETQDELRRATALLQQAIPLLEQASEREEAKTHLEV